MTTLLDRAARARRLPLLTAGLAVALALLGQQQFSRGPNNLRVGITLFLLAIGCFVIADWLHARRTDIDSDPPTPPERRTPSARRERQPAVEDLWTTTLRVLT